jgi:transcriptional regulator GlxA family with amidase domain
MPARWCRAAQLAREYPALTVDCDPVFINDGRLWTSAGVTAGMDLALALVEEDLGTAAAHTVAQYLVLFLRRPGSQSQFSVPLWSAQPATDPIRAVVAAVQARPGLHGRDHARAVRRQIQYEPAPPYLADEPVPGPG